jgi:hypothetical protein
LELYEWLVDNTEEYLLPAIGITVCMMSMASLPAIVGEGEGAKEEFANIDEASNHIPIVVELNSG